MDDTPLRGRQNRKFCSQACKGRAKALKENFGLTVKHYREMIRASEGLCPICKEVPVRWHVDHDHLTGKVTGVVCQRCNIGPLMTSRHDPALVRSLLRYLEKPPAEQLGIFAKADPRREQPAGLHHMWQNCASRGAGS